MEQQLPYSLFVLLEISKGLLTPVVAGFGLWIASNQLKVSQAKLRFDLFEKRYKIYDSIKGLLTTLVREGAGNALKNYALVREFDVGTADTRFLFDQTIVEHFAGMRKKLVYLTYLSQENIRQNEQLGGKPDFEKEIKLFTELIEELTNHSVKFERFLKVE